MIETNYQNDIVIVTINTGKGNTFNIDDLLEFCKVVDEIELNLEVKCVIITGANNCFSTGGNIEYISSLKSRTEIQIYFSTIDRLIIKLFSSSKMIISAVNGHCIGLGFLIALTSDQIFCLDNEKIKYGLPEIKIGMLLDDVMLEVLQFNNLKGRRISDLLYSGELFTVKYLQSLLSINLESDRDLLMRNSINHFNNFVHEGKILSFSKLKQLIRHTYIYKTNMYFEASCFTIFNDCLIHIKN